jgi:hypothetical protein
LLEVVQVERVFFDSSSRATLVRRPSFVRSLERLNGPWARQPIDGDQGPSNTCKAYSHGEQTLTDRLAQQAHWRQAEAVRHGSQAPTDPDAYELEEVRDGVRLYNIREQRRKTVDGRKMLVTERLTKRLIDGRWTTVYETEGVRPA